MATIRVEITGCQDLPDMTWTNGDVHTRGNPAYEADVLQQELLAVLRAALEHLKPHVVYRGGDEMKRNLLRRIEVTLEGGQQP